MPNDEQVREHIINLIRGKQAHITFEQAIANLPKSYRGRGSQHIPFTIWQLVKHLAISQHDIIRFSINPDYETPVWPDDYWPQNPEPLGDDEWQATLDIIKEDKKKMIDLISDQENDLFEPFPWGDGQTLMREALVIVDHNSYHIGQIVLLRRILKAW